MATTPIPPVPPQAYSPYAGDYSTYGLGGEHLFFGNQLAPPPVTPPVPGVPGAPGPPGAPPPAAGEPPPHGSSGGHGNDGGARNADNRASRAGNDRAAFAAGMGGDGSPLGGGTPVGPGTGDYVTMPGWLDTVTSAAGTLLPFPYSVPFTVGRTAARAYNMLGPTDENRQALGLPGLSGWQIAGGLIGSPYGNFQNPEISNAEQAAGQFPAGWDYGVTQYGGQMPGFQLGPFQIGGGETTLGMQDAWEMHNLKIADDEALAGTLQQWKPASGPLGGNSGRGRGDATGVSSSSGGYGYQPGGGQSYDAASGSWGAPRDSTDSGGGGNAGGASNNSGSQSGGGGNFGGVPSGFRMARGGLADVRPTTLRRGRNLGKQRRALPGHTTPDPRRLLAAGAPNPPLPGGLGSVQQFDKGGFVRSRGAGRSDSVNTKVPENTYIFPADYVAARGQGNSLHGAHVIDHLVRRVTARPQLAGGGRLPRPGKKTVPVALSGGEYRAPPHFVYAVGGGDYDRGSAILDHEVTSTRGRFAQHLQSLPPPKK